jgi:hypothetical protein
MPAKCPSVLGAAVPDAATARTIATAIIRARQSPEVMKRYTLHVDVERYGNWRVWQGIPERYDAKSIIITNGGGGIAMTINRCTAAVSDFYFQK